MAGGEIRPMMPFARPWLLLLLLAIPIWLWRRRRQVWPVPASELALPGHAARHTWWPRIPVALRALTFGCWVIAAAGPRLGPRALELRGEGIAIALAVDVSSSMLAEDFAPSNRLEVAKRQAISFIRGRSSDRIGLVTFAGEALTQVPLTLDYAVLEQSIGNLRVGTLEDGTAIGTGLATALNRLRRIPGRSKVVLLLTDGENNRGAVDPHTAADAAAALGVRVYTIGVGTEGEARVPTGRGLSGLRYEVVPVRIDEVLLRDIADRTGGRYFRATDGAALARVFHQIDALERTTQVQTMFSNRAETIRPFVLAGLVFLSIELLLGATVVVRVP
jgi:Ca-activated chloride channel family protein